MIKGLQYKELENGIRIPIVEMPKTEEEIYQQAGRYGKMRMEFLSERYTREYKKQLALGILEETIQKCEEEALDLDWKIRDQYARTHPTTTWEENLHMEQEAEQLAEETVIADVIERLL